MRRLSKLLLLGQAPFLAHLSFLGLLLCAGAMVPFLSGAITKEQAVEFVAGIIILFALVAGWRIWFWVMADGPAENKSIHTAWWLFSAVGISLTLLSLLSRFVSQSFGMEFTMPVAELFLHGVYFFPSLLHIILEIWRQRGANAFNTDAPSRRAG